MLDLRFVRDHIDKVEEALKNRGLTEVPLEEFRHRDAERRRLLTQVEALRHERNTLSQKVGDLIKAGQKAEAEPLKFRVSVINEDIKTQEARAMEHDAWLRDFLLSLPNLPHETVPVGAESRDNPVVGTWGEAPAV